MRTHVFKTLILFHQQSQFLADLKDFFFDDLDLRVMFAQRLKRIFASLLHRVTQLLLQ